MTPLTCVTCAGEIPAPKGRGRPPKRCKPCQAERRRAFKAKQAEQYREIARVQLQVSVSDIMIAAAVGYGEGWHLDAGREIPGSRGRKGADEGHTTSYKDLAGELTERARLAGVDGWWDENPRALTGLWDE